MSSGDIMTGYLTWTYGSARGEAVEYGWNTLLEAGGSMGPLNKSITFGATLPEGTQLTLVDTAHNNREYHCTVGAGGAASVKLTEFVDASKKAYVEPWLSETVGVKADEAKEDKDGAWVKLADDEVKDKSQAELAKMAGAKSMARTTARALLPTRRARSIPSPLIRKSPRAKTSTWWCARRRGPRASTATPPPRWTRALTSTSTTCCEAR